MKDKSFVVIVVSLLVLIGAAVWQFHTLSGGSTSGYTVDRSGGLPSNQIRRSTLINSPK